jgi:hypothetical protein
MAGSLKKECSYLVGNAIKFTDVGEVAVWVEANNGSFQILLRDTGLGICAADRSAAKLLTKDEAVIRMRLGFHRSRSMWGLRLRNRLRLRYYLASVDCASSG